jgi:single-strand DNA-binding protein
MTDTITLTGLVATDPRHVVTSEGLAITSFRLASTQRRFDRGQEKWIDGDTNWYTITTFRQLAMNCAGSIKKGERVVVTGRLRIREWQSGERTGLNIDVEADALGHDLAWGTSAFSRSISATAVAADSAPAAVDEPTSDSTAAESTAGEPPAEGSSADDQVSGQSEGSRPMATLPF